MNMTLGFTLITYIYLSLLIKYYRIYSGINDKVLFAHGISRVAVFFSLKGGTNGKLNFRLIILVITHE